MVQVVFNIKSSEKMIARRMRDAIKQEARSFLAARIKRIRDRTRLIVGNYIMNSPEVQDLINGRLQTELGVVDPAEQMTGIVETWSRSIHVVVKPPRKYKDGIQMGFRLLGIKGDWADVLASGFGVYTTMKGSDIPWLGWLLVGGRGIIVRDFDIAFGYPMFSRTGDAIMLQGSGWRVPASAQGTTTNNFATRAIDKCLPAIETMIIAELTK